MYNKDTNLDDLQVELNGKSPRVILKAALSRFKNIAISFSGSEDVVLIDMAVQIRPDVQIFCLDTGRLHAETYQFIEAVRKHYSVQIEMLYPNYSELESMVKLKGLFSFYEEGHAECCGIRKVAPLRRKLSSLDAWITGQRRDQSSSRTDLLEVEQDTSSGRPGLLKFNPLANWNSAQVWDHIEAYQVPFNALHRMGYVSIGCEPCTRTVLPHQHEREGRWWWEDQSKKECGLHIGNLETRI